MFYSILKTVALATTVTFASNSGALAMPASIPASATMTSQSPDQNPEALIRVGSHSMQNGACFYTRYDYRGDKVCYGMGEFGRLPYAIKNHFRSVRLLGYGRVDLCTRKNLRGKCTTIYESMRRLPRALANTTYSLEIYRADRRGYDDDRYDDDRYGGGGYNDRDRGGY